MESQKLSRRENLYLINRYTPDLVYNESRLLGGVTATFADVQTILDNGDVPVNISPADVYIISSLKKGLQCIGFIHGKLSIKIIKYLNTIVGYDTRILGQFANQNMQMPDVKYRPAVMSQKKMFRVINLYNNSKKGTIRAIHLMLKLDRNQFFWGGNKQTAWLVASYCLLSHGDGILNIKYNQKNMWLLLLRQFYKTGKINTLSNWLLKNCIINRL